MQKASSGFLRPVHLVLKEAREKRNIPLEIAHRDTKIHAKILRALEEGTSLDLDPVYINSYIKIYGRYLGVDNAELDRYLHKDTKEQHPDATAKQPQKPFNVYEEGSGTLSNLSFQLNPRNIIYVIVGLVLLVSVFKFIGKPGEPRREPVKATSQKIVRPTNEIKQKAESKQIPVAVEKSSQSESKLVLPKGVQDILRLTILAEEDTWMQVKSDGKVVFKRILKKSTSETWQAKESFELWLANAGTVRLELNGKILSPIGRRGQLLKSVVITKDGFTVNR